MPQLGTRGTRWAISGKRRSISNLSAMCSRPLHRAHFFPACVLLADKKGSFTENACQNRLARQLLAMTKSEPKKRQSSEKEGHRTLGMVLIAVELRIRRAGWAKRMAEQTQTDNFFHQQSVSNDLWADTSGQVPLPNQRRGADNVRHPMGKAVSGCY